MKKERYKHGRKIDRITDRLIILFMGCIILLGGILIYRSIAKLDVGNNDEKAVYVDSDKNSNNESDFNKSSKKEITLSFAGDFTLGTDSRFDYQTSLPAAFSKSGNDYNYFMKNVEDVFNNDDYTLVNLETTLTDSDEKLKKSGSVYYNFKGPKDYVNILTHSSIEGVTIANNHIYDYGTEGFKDTVEALKEKKVDVCGEGYIILKDIKGIKVGFLGYQGWSYTAELKDKISNDIRELRNKGAQVVIPYFHWGIENTYNPCDVQEELAKYAVDNGADVVIGSHPHVIQSMEDYKGKLIVYSMGNFCFGGNSNPSDKRTFILQIRITAENNKAYSYEYKVIPASISSRNDLNDYVPTLSQGEEKGDTLKALNDLSPTLNGNIKDEFFGIE